VKQAGEGERGRAGGLVAARRAIALFALIAPALPLSRPAAAQEPAPRSVDARPWFVSVSHYGKWVGLAGAAGLTAVAILRNEDADRVYDGLASLCRAGGETCVLNEAGTYLNPQAEALYQETLRLDSEARKWMVGGQAALVVAGTMFVIDLVSGTKKPKNIPYAPVEYFSDGRRVGLRVRF
jgi:hypothetical protein